MDPTDEISREMLKKAFSLAEESLSGKKNRFITGVITNEVSSIGGHEGLVNAVIARALYDVFSSLDVKTEHKRIDIGLMNEDGEIVAAVEGKMMVSNSWKRAIKNSIDVQGIDVKLNSDKNSVRTYASVM